MTTKEYLRQYKKLDNRIASRLLELEEYKSLVFGIRGIDYDKDRVDATSDFDKVCKSLGKLEELEEEIGIEIKKCQMKKELIVKQIESLDSIQQYNILFNIYVKNKALNEISVKEGYSYRSVTRLHSTALKSFKKKYGKDYENAKNIVVF